MSIKCNNANLFECDGGPFLLQGLPQQAGGVEDVQPGIQLRVPSNLLQLAHNEAPNL